MAIVIIISLFTNSCYYSKPITCKSVSDRRVYWYSLNERRLSIDGKTIFKKGKGCSAKDKKFFLNFIGSLRFGTISAFLQKHQETYNKIIIILDIISSINNKQSIKTIKNNN